MAHFLEIHSPDRASTRHELPSGRVTLGCGRGDTIQLPGASEPETIALEVGEGGVALRLASTTPDALVFEGVVYRELRAPWGSEIYWGASRFVFLRDESAPRHGSLKLLVAVGLLTVALGGLSFGAKERELGETDIEAPSILSGEATCPADPAGALRRARSAEERARAKEARFPYSWGDGVRAEKLYAEAERCFGLAGEAEEAARLQGEHTRWRARLADEYRTQRLRLRVALDGERFAEAWSAARALGALLDAAEIEGEHPYRRWLTDLTRRLQERVERSRR